MKNPQVEKVYRTIRKLIMHNRTFFIAGHRRPDGDSVAAQLVLASMLKRLKKKFEIYSIDPVPKNLRFLPGASQIKVRRRVHAFYDVAFVIECSGQDRMGNIIDLKKQAAHVVNIDHHTHFNQFGEVNLVNPHASSSCEQIHRLFNILNVNMTYEDAVCLYAGILTDTGCFRHANTTSLVHRLAADYIALGISPDEMFNSIYQQKTLHDLTSLGKILSGMKTYHKGKVAVIEITSKHGDTEDVINFGMMLASVRIAVLFQPVSRKKVRVSFRSRGTIDVGKLAVNFGGGGHMHAAGCTIIGTLRSVQKKVLPLLSLGVRPPHSTKLDNRK